MFNFFLIMKVISAKHQLWARQFGQSGHSSFHPMDEPKNADFEKDASEHVFDEIFKTNSDGTVSDDLSMWLSERTSPQIRDFISSQLLQKTEVEPLKEGLTVDDVERYSRQAGETRIEYAARLKQLAIEDYKHDVEKSKQQKK